MNKDTFDNTYESSLNSSQREKFFSSFSHQIPPLRLKKGSALPHLADEQAPHSTRRGPLAHQNFLKKSLNVSQEALDMKNSYPVAQMSATHKRSGSMVQFTPQLKKEDFFSAKPKKDLVVEIPQTAKEGTAALQELLRASTIYNKMPSQGLLTPQGMVSVPKGGISSYNNTISPKYTKEASNKNNMRDSQEVPQGVLKGIVISESRNKQGSYQRRFLALKEHSPHGAHEGLTTPKLSSKNAEGFLKVSPKAPQSRETQVLREALSQYLQVKTPSQDLGTQSVKQMSPVASEKKIINLVGYPSPRVLNSAVMNKRGMTGHSNRMINNSGERDLKSPSRDDSGVIVEQASMMAQMMQGSRRPKKAPQEEEAKQERPRIVEQANAGECEEDYYKEFLGVSQQTFDFEKMVVDQRDLQKTKKEPNMFISVASPMGRKDNSSPDTHRKLAKNDEQGGKGGDTMLRSMFAFYAKESGRQAPTMDSSKNDKGSSTTCNSLKLMKEQSSKREERPRAEDDICLEEVLQGVDSATRK